MQKTTPDDFISHWPKREDFTNKLSKEVVGWIGAFWKRNEQDFPCVKLDAAFEFTISDHYLETNMTNEFLAWQHRDFDWPSKDLIQRVKMEKARLSLRVDKQGNGNTDIDMSLTYSLSPLLYTIQGRLNFLGKLVRIRKI